MAYFLGKGLTPEQLREPSGGGGTSPTPRSPTPIPGTPTPTPKAPKPEDMALCLQRCGANYPYGSPAFEDCQRKCQGLPEPLPKVGECPAEASGSNHSYASDEECPCGDEWNTPTQNCPSGYVFQSKLIGGKPVEGMVGRCICEKLTHGTAGAAGSLGEYTPPGGMSDLMSLLLGRGKELMGMPTGYSQDAMDKMFGLNFENVRAQEKPAREELLTGLSRQGMLGTGTAQKQLGNLAWNAEENITDLARQLFIGNEEKKKADLLDYTGAAGNILSGGMGYEQLLESINAARRGEGNTALLMLLQLLGLYQ